MVAKGWARFLCLSAAFCGAGVWVLASLSATDGVWIAASGVALWGAAASLALRRPARPGFLFAYTLGVWLLTASALIFEGTLRVAPGILAGQAANIAYGGYHTGPGGIYRRDRHLGNALRPDTVRRICWNGHWWRHQTNHAGYRGTALASPEVVLLGDSMIYGHGVDQDGTVADQLARRSGKGVANLGQQGTCATQALALIERHGSDWQPRWVIHCAHPNDIAESTTWYAEPELEEFLQTGISEPSVPLAKEKFRPRPWWDLTEGWNRYCALPLRAAGALKALHRGLARSSAHDGSTPEVSLADRPFVPSEMALNERVAPPVPGRGMNGDQRMESLRWRVHEHALAKLREFCRRRGATLVLFDIGYPYSFTKATEDLAERLGLPYSSAGRVALERAQGGEDIYLANDGHWSASGGAIVAGRLAEDLERLERGRPLARVEPGSVR